MLSGSESHCECDAGSSKPTLIIRNRVRDGGYRPTNPFFYLRVGNKAVPLAPDKQNV